MFIEQKYNILRKGAPICTSPNAGVIEKSLNFSSELEGLIPLFLMLLNESLHQVSDGFGLSDARFLTSFLELICKLPGHLE